MFISASVFRGICPHGHGDVRYPVSTFEVTSASNGGFLNSVDWFVECHSSFIVKDRLELH